MNYIPNMGKSVCVTPTGLEAVKYSSYYCYTPTELEVELFTYY